MQNPEGTPIWYELLTADAASAATFYEAVVGWKVQAHGPGAVDGYRHIETPQGFVGGFMPLDEKMRAGGARPTWLFYLGVNDVDATVKKIQAEGGMVLMPAFDMEKVGRMALVADPQGIPFYVMRGSTDEASTAFDRQGLGKCNWNELATPHHAAANAFYAKVFGWTYPDKMSMPGGTEYVFVAAGGTTFGATMPQEEGQPSGWRFYFRTPDIEAAAERVKTAGGTVHAGPMEVPGGERVILATDPEGVHFGVVAPR